MRARFRGIDWLRRGRRVGLAAAVAIACTGSALAASGCGSVSSVVDPVARAASISNAAPGYRMRFSLLISSSALPTSLTTTGTGSFDAPARLAGLTMKMNFGSNPQIAAALGGSSLSLGGWGHNLVRRLRLSISEKLPSGQQVSSLYDITIPEYGPQNPPALPPADQVSDLGSLIGSHA